MITINLLPQELRKKPSIFSGLNLKGIDVKSIPVLNIAAIVGVCVVFVQLIVFVIMMLLNTQFASTTRKYEALALKKKEADALKAKMSDIDKRSRAIDELMTKRFSWAKKMNILSDCVTPGIWLSEINYDERPIVGREKPVMPGALVMGGYASGAGEQGTALIGKFIKGLQNNKDFYSDFVSVDLVSTKSEKVDNQDVMSFRITCLFK